MPVLKQVSTPDQICREWDSLAGSYYLKKSFLNHIHQYNYCNQRYYELYDNDRFVAGTILYTLNINLFTFSKLKLNLPMHIIGLPVSVANEPFVGEGSYFEPLLDEILSAEKGLILGLNFKNDHCNGKVLHMRTLPTVVMKNAYPDLSSYLGMMRHPYRRRIKLQQSKFAAVTSGRSLCDKFTDEHYRLYLDVMERSTTKLEVLSLEFFQNLPSDFILTTHYYRNLIIAWQICLPDKDILCFFFGGLNYKYRDLYGSYYNNLLSIVDFGISIKCDAFDFGQTAEIAKLRLGGHLDERRMFMYHHIPPILLLLKLFKGFIGYSKKQQLPKVFKEI